MNTDVMKGDIMAHKNDEAVIDLIKRNWEEIAAGAFEIFVCYDPLRATAAAPPVTMLPTIIPTIRYHNRPNR